MNESELDPEAARQEAMRVYRILTNALVLFDVGHFPGQHSSGITEVKEFLAKLQGAAKGSLTALTPAPAAPPAAAPAIVPPPAPAPVPPAAA